MTLSPAYPSKHAATAISHCLISNPLPHKNTRMNAHIHTYIQAHVRARADTQHTHHHRDRNNNNNIEKKATSPSPVTASTTHPHAEQSPYREVPEYVNEASLLRSKTGAHWAHMACMAGNVTPCNSHTPLHTTESHTLQRSHPPTRN